jgi:AmmeMemoRadiSam system protein A
MNDNQKQILLKIARDNVESAVLHKSLPAPHSDDPELNQPCGCFVTLKNGDDLRGCIGQFVADRPLIEMVALMAQASAAGDPRFFANPITDHELNLLDIEISVLSPLQKTDNPLSLRLGIDGIYIKKGYHSGCFLPQVATETGWNKQQFLSFCCSHKAGLSPNAWKDKDTDVFLFTAEIFSAHLKNL